MHQLPRMNVKFDFICMQPVQVRGTRNQRKYQNEKFLFTIGFELLLGRVPSLQLYRLNHTAKSRLFNAMNEGIKCPYNTC